MKQVNTHLPQQFIERLHQIIPAERIDTVLASFALQKPTTFRTNTLKITTVDLEKKLKKNAIQFEKISWYPDAFILKSEKRILMENDIYTSGLVYIQNLSSMIPALILDPKPYEIILDIAASPGSKTTQIATLMNNSGQIIANDKSRARLYKLDAVLKQQGVNNTRTINMPGEIIWKIYPEYFDKSSVDVPCTMEGRFFAGDADTYKDWSPKKIKMLTQTQRYLLRSAVSSTKPGGSIVYSTCTLAPEENEEVIDWLLRVEKDSIEIEQISLETIPFVDGLTIWKKKEFDKKLQRTKRILPSEVMEGFFIAKIKKLKQTVTNTH